MRTSLLILVPGVLLAGFLFFVFRVSSFTPAEAPCALGACPLSLHESDSGKTFVYNVGTRFDIYLNNDNSPSATLRCTPEGVITPGQLAQAVESSDYKMPFAAVEAGICVLTDKNFSATIVIR